jgi:cell division protein FtsI (penicillin-binding protein 3)
MVERRLVWLAWIVLLWGGAIFVKLLTLQVVRHQEFVQKARNRQEEVVELRAQRGAILDRTGHPLALSVPTESVSIDPVKLPALEFDSDLLAHELHVDPAELAARIRNATAHHRQFLWVKRGITPQEAQDVRNLKLEWIHVDDGSERHYPNALLAAHVLGGVDFEEKGNAGMEKALDNELRGAAGKARILTDVHRRGIDELVSAEARPGVTVVLTIDEQLQFVAEREIAAAVKLHNAVSGSVVVMTPNDGQILALASYPPYDPNQTPENGDDVAARSNHAVSVPFEPGSCFKMITLAAALETTKIRPDTLINCHGGILVLPGRVIHEAESHEHFGLLPMAMVLAHSSNIGAIEIGRAVGREGMYDYIRRFGFGEKTGIPLPGESRGRLRRLPQWGKTSLESLSMGQEVSVTTLQLARAAAVVANGGLLVKPRLVLKLGDQAPPMEPPVRAIRPETAITMRQMMEGVVLVGTGKAARLDGYTTGGKTGSAQIFDFATRHYTHTYNGSFMGFAPVTNPAVVVVVTLNGTRGLGGFGGVVAAPVFKVVATEALRILDVPKDLPDDPPPPKNALAKIQANDMPIADLGSGERNILEDPEDDEQPAQPAPGFVGPVPPATAPSAGTVPNFRGMTLRAVLSEAAEKGLTVLPDGSGIARVQTPKPGSMLHQGERIRVKFAR